MISRKTPKKRTVIDRHVIPSIGEEFLGDVLKVLNEARKSLGKGKTRKIQKGTIKNSNCPISATLGLEPNILEVVHTKKDGVGAFVHDEDVAEKLSLAWNKPLFKINKWCWFLPLPDVLFEFTILYDCYIVPELIK